jgi:hypothetical protein
MFISFTFSLGQGMFNIIRIHHNFCNLLNILIIISCWPVLKKTHFVYVTFTFNKSLMFYVYRQILEVFSFTTVTYILARLHPLF